MKQAAVTLWKPKENASDCSILLRLILWMTPLLIAVDTLNGVTVRLGVSVSQPVKLFYLLMLSVAALRYSCGVAVLLASLFVDFMYVSFHAIFLLKTETIFSDLQWLLRFNIFWIGGFVFSQFFIKNLLTDKQTYKIYLFVSAVLAANLVAGTFGYGYSQYSSGSPDEGIGARGFIYAGNEMSFLIILCQIMVLGYLYNNKKFFGYCFFVLAFFIMAVLKVTKTAMLGSLLVSMSYPIAGFFVKTMIEKKGVGKSFFLLGAAITGLFVALPYAYDLVISTGVMNRIEYFIEDRGFIGAMLSGRDEFAVIMWKYFSENYSIAEVFFGSGSFVQLVEIDFLDFLSVFGVSGVIICYGFLIVVGINALLKVSLTTRPWAVGVFFVVLFSFFISLIAGHVLYSGLATPYMGLAVAHLYIKKSK